MTAEQPEKSGSEGIPSRWWLRLGHDLRGPIAPMRMALQLLRSGQATSADQQDALRVLDRQLEQLLVNIDDLSDLARINAGNLTSNLSPADLNLVLDIVAGNRALCQCLEEKQQSLRCIPAENAVMAQHDTRRVAGLVQYLVGRSAKYAPSGSEITLLLDPATGLDRVRLRIVGAGASLLNDPEFAYVAGFTTIDPVELEAKPIVMREIVRSNGISFLSDDGNSGITLTLPRLA